MPACALPFRLRAPSCLLQPWPANRPALREQVAMQVEKNVLLEKQVRRLQEKIQDLRRQVHRDRSNSGQAPSQDGPIWASPAIRWLDGDAAGLCTTLSGTVPVVLRRCSRGTPRVGPGPVGRGFCLSGGGRDREKGGLPVQRVSRTRARASAKVGRALGIPGGPARHQGPAPQQGVGDHGHPTEETQQDGRGAGDGGGRPLALGLPAQVGAHGLEGDLHLPATQEPGHHRVRCALRVGAEQGRRCADPDRVPQQDPTQGHDGLAGVVPEGCARGIVQDLAAPVVPAYGQRSPGRLWVCQPLPQRGQTRPLEPRAAGLAWSPRRRRRIQGCIPGAGARRPQWTVVDRPPAGAGWRRSGRPPRPVPGRAASGAGDPASGAPSR